MSEENEKINDVEISCKGIDMMINNDWEGCEKLYTQYKYNKLNFVVAKERTAVLLIATTENTYRSPSAVSTKACMLGLDPPIKLE
jgi:hypothetical protein